jgi:hypothetical protein
MHQIAEIISTLAKLQAILNEELHAEGMPYSYRIALEPGKVYARIVRREVWHNNPGEEVNGSVYGFVKLSDLTLWKAAGYKAPAKNKPRGMLHDLECRASVLPGWRYSIS